MKNVGSSHTNVRPDFRYIMQQSAAAVKQAQVRIPANLCNAAVNYCQQKKYQ